MGEGIAGNQKREGLKVHVISSEPSFPEEVKAALNHNGVHVFASTEEAVNEVIRNRDSRMQMVVIDLTSIADGDRLIHFLKWAGPTRHVQVIGVGYDGDFAALAPDALRLLDGAVKKPFTGPQLTAAAEAADRPKRIG